MNERSYQCTKCKEYKAISPLTECDDCVEKQHLLETKAAKWDMIQSCIKNKQSIGKKASIFEIAEIVEQLYKESEQNES